MANLKMLKLPKKPRPPKKPAQTASLQTKQAWLHKVKDMATKYHAKSQAITRENTRRKAINEASKKASTIIAGIGDILEVRPSAFKVSTVRSPRKYGHAGGAKKKTAKKKSAVSGTKRKKAAPKKKTARRY